MTSEFKDPCFKCHYRSKNQECIGVCSVVLDFNLNHWGED